MPRSLFVSMLLAVQLLSWSGPSMYLCLGSDGSVCVDFGPANCRCCQHHGDADGCGASHKHHQSPERCNDSQRQELLLVADRDCDCSHIQIVQQQGPVVVQTSLKQASDHGWTISSAIGFQTAQPTAVVVEHASSRPTLAGSASSFPALLASVVLRC
jgi:hypothetical protein